MSRDLSTIVKAYDVRGTVPDQLDADTARALGAAFARFAGAPTVVVARDMRESGVELGAAFADGVTSQGVDVIDAGMGSTDLLYYAAGILDVPGAMFTASHNPAQYNGIKMCLAGAKPIGQESGLVDIRTDAERFLDEGVPRRRPAGRDDAARPARRLRRLPQDPRAGAGRASARSRSSSTAATAWAASRCRRSSRACRSRSPRCTSRSTAASRTTRRTRSTRPTRPTCRRASARRAPTSASPSTATPTAASSSTSAARSSAPRR